MFIFDCISSYEKSDDGDLGDPDAGEEGDGVLFLRRRKACIPLSDCVPLFFD